MTRSLIVVAGLVLVLGLGLAALLPMVLGSVHGDVSVAAFGVAGTIVALVLPAAGLGGDAARRTIDYYAEGTASAMERLASGRASAEPQLTPLQWAQAGLTQINSLRVRITAARWGSGLVYVALLLSMVSLLQIKQPIVLHIDSKPVLAWHIAIALALACLALGTILFLPLAWWFWTIKSLAGSEKAMRWVVDNPRTAEPLHPRARSERGERAHNIDGLERREHE